MDLFLARVCITRMPKRQNISVGYRDTEMGKRFFLSQNSCRSAAVLLYMYVCTIDIEIWLWLSMFSQVLHNRFVLRGICLHHLTYSVLRHVTIRRHSLVTRTHCGSMVPHPHIFWTSYSQIIFDYYIDIYCCEDIYCIIIKHTLDVSTARERRQI